VNSEEGQINLHEEAIDIRAQIGDDPSQQLVDDDDEAKRRKVTQKAYSPDVTPLPPAHCYG